MAHGPRNLIDAIADGQRAAASIHRAGDRPTPPADGVRVELSRRAGFRRLSTGYDAIARQPVPATPSDRRVGFAEVEAGYDAQDAWLESLRCLRCFDNVMLDPDLCILCGLCVDVCPPNCITIARADHGGPRHRVAERAAPRRGPVHPLRALRQPLPAGSAVDGARTGGDHD